MRERATTCAAGEADSPKFELASGIKSNLVSFERVLVSVGDVRLFVDVDGAKLVPDGESMRERPTIVMLHGNGADHSPFKERFAPGHR
jgi:hypothetical protein